MIRPDQIKCVFRYIFVFVSCVFSYWVIHETLSYNALCDSIRDDENVTLWTTAHQFTNSHSMDRRYGPSSCHSDVSRGSGIFHQIAFAPHFMVLRYIFHVMQFIKTTCFAVERRNSRNKLHSDTIQWIHSCYVSPNEEGNTRKYCQSRHASACAAAAAVRWTLNSSAMPVVDSQTDVFAGIWLAPRRMNRRNNDRMLNELSLLFVHFQTDWI